ncbi:hypothetical protein [Rhizobium freirei]|uniref:hypothetical protein n=1 Tax=Rhizobium freirei TaxID=1353277 RepID=UPI0012FA8CD4|nr:hypothetical protein [Rhizobium freirei]
MAELVAIEFYTEAETARHGNGAIDIRHRPADDDVLGELMVMRIRRMGEVRQERR